MIKIITTLSWVDSEGGEHEVHKETLGSVLDVEGTFANAVQDLGKLESYINRLIAKGEETKED